MVIFMHEIRQNGENWQNKQYLTKIFLDSGFNRHLNSTYVLQELNRNLQSQCERSTADSASGSWRIRILKHRYKDLFIRSVDA